jgi:hypothetical protein
MPRREASVVACSVCHRGTADQEVSPTLYAGLDLSGKRVDVCLTGELVEAETVQSWTGVDIATPWP